MKGLFFAFIIGAVAYAIFGKKLMGLMSKKNETLADITIETVNDDNLTT
jgi:outer membrane lipoprotein SlyB